ncbi:hypothetical protein PybrP1_010486 [[Pythium] brassicae (nom. inval.)]|nr:hypothetical protein PybrP1_010486 [[Pythium] brassicae (nom. inval.)]
MPLITIKRALLVALVLVCVTSDAFLAQTRVLADWKLLRHLADSAAHGAVGFCVAAALLDVDHFIEGGFSIDGATHLKHRPFGHAVTFIGALALLVHACSPRDVRARRVSFVVVTLLSHQLRDGMRLGLWFWPLGSTPPIEYLLYLMLELVLPFALAAADEKWTTGASPGREERGFKYVPQERDEDVGQNDDDDNENDGGRIELRVVSS